MFYFTIGEDPEGNWIFEKICQDVNKLPKDENIYYSHERVLNIDNIYDSKVYTGTSWQEGYLLGDKFYRDEDISYDEDLDKYRFVNRIQTYEKGKLVDTKYDSIN